VDLRRVEEAFSRARRLEARERATFLRELDTGIRGEVEALLSHHEAAEGVDLEPPFAGAAPRIWAELTGPPAPALEGFTVLRRLGSGAMGTVYEAEQARPRRRVAIKMPHLPTAEGRARFEREARMLARLEHPGIARILAQGKEETPDGPRPYLVMEMVDGVPLHEYARGRGLRVVLDLLRQVCDAVAHAHVRGVMHRDLKPGNILVTQAGEVKVLDFGLARPIEGGSLRTREGNVLGTLAYMSPEQASGDPGAVDTRSDVYAIGVIAYELVAGRLPLALEGRSLPEALRAIREEEPPRLERCGDLAWIVAKAMEKEKRRRYSNADALGEDLARYAANEPVLARPPTATYQLRKFVRRHRALVGGAAATVLALVIGLAVAIGFARAEHRQEARARHVAALAQLRLACAALDAGLPGLLSQHLAGVPDDERGWAWRHLLQRRDTSETSVPHGLHLRKGELGADAAVAAILEWSGRAHLLDARTGEPLPGPERWSGGGWLGACLGGGEAWMARRDGDHVLLRSAGGRELRVAGRTEGALAADPSGALLAIGLTGPEHACVLVDVATGGERWRAALDDAPYALSFSGDGSALAIGSRDATVRVYDVADGRLRFAVRTETQNVECIALDGTGRRLAIGSLDHSIEIRDAETGELRHRLTGHGAAVRCLAFSPASGLLVSGASDRTMRVWDPRTGDCRRILQGHESAVMAIGFEPDGTFRSLSLEDLRTWRRDDPGVLRAHAGIADGNPEPYVYGVAFRPDGAHVASCGWDRTTRVFDATTRRELACFRSNAPVRAVAYSPDGRWIASASDVIEVRDADTGAPRGRYAQGRGSWQRVVFLPGGNRLVAAHARHLDLVDLESGKVRSWPCGPTGFARVACTPDGALMAYGEGKTDVVLRRVADGEVVTRWMADRRGVDCFAVSPDGRLLATGGGDSVVRLWSLPGGEPVAALRGHTLVVYALAFSPDGRWLASGSDDHTIRLWDLDRHEERLTLEGHERYVFDVAFSPDGRTLASASGDNTVRFWSIVPERERAAAARAIDAAEAALREGRPAGDGEAARRAAGDLALERGASGG